VITAIRFLGDAAVGGTAGAIVALFGTRRRRHREQGERDDVDRDEGLSAYDTMIDEATRAWVSEHGREEMAAVVGEKMRLLSRLHERRKQSGHWR